MAGANFGLSIVESECVPGSLPLKLRSFRVDSGHGKNYIKKPGGSRYWETLSR
jgi:3-dehydroquinate synthase class II